MRVRAAWPLKMSNDKLLLLLARLKEDASLRKSLQDAGDPDAFGALAKDAGFDVDKADLLRYQAGQLLELSDQDLENVAGAFGDTLHTLGWSLCRFETVCPMCDWG